jgi:pseudouridine-5'-monophosphatase
MGRTGQEVAEIICRELDLPITVDQYLELINEEYIKVFENVQFMPGAEELVKHLHKNSIPIAIATSSKRSTFELKTKNLKNIFNLFEHILIASDDLEITRGKPDPQTFLVCASRFANKPKDMSNVLVFEDSPSGVKSAMSAGMQCVWVPDPRIDRNLAKSTLVLDSLFHFRTELFNLPKF